MPEPEQGDAICIHCGAEVFWGLPLPEDPCFECGKPVAEQGDVEVIRAYLESHRQIVDQPDEKFVSRVAPSVLPALSALDRIVAALAETEVDARWIVGQWQRLGDTPVQEVALAMVARLDALCGDER